MVRADFPTPVRVSKIQRSVRGVRAEARLGGVMGLGFSERTYGVGEPTSMDEKRG
jgi:hypothetical protein